MRKSLRFTLTCLVAAACGGDGGGPAVPDHLQIVSGDGQTAFLSAALADSLVVRVLDANGGNVSGISVTFVVTSGSATTSPIAAASDANGLARSQVTVGATPGAITITAAVANIPPVVFNATGQSNCSVLTPHTVGTTSPGQLTNTDCNLGGYYTDFFSFSLAGQQALTIRETAAFDTWFDMGAAGGTFFLAFNDDEDTTTLNSRVDIVLAPGNYIVAPSSLDQAITGAYNLITATRSTDLVGCEFVWSSRAVSITGNVALTDCEDSVAAGLFYSDAMAVALQQGETLKVRLASAAFDPVITVIDGFRDSIVVVNDDSASGVTTTSYAVWVAAFSTVVIVDLGTKNPGESGAYTATLTGPVILSGNARDRRAGGMGGLDYRLTRLEIPNASVRDLVRARFGRHHPRRPG